MTNKKAAMFGLDARIALAIFGALSIISGAALYSAIQEAKTTSLLNDINEIGKAWEQYMLDTGSDLPDAGGIYSPHRSLIPLISSSDPNWNGPYLNYTASADNPTLIIGNEKYQYITLPPTSILPWGDGHAVPHWNSANACNDTTIPCYATIQIGDKRAGNTIIEQAKRLDIKIDNGDGAYSGKIRWYTLVGENVLAYIYAPHKMPK